MITALAGMMVLIWPLLLVVAIVWIILPFGIFGTKPILREILRELQEIRRLQLATYGNPETHVLCPECREPVRTDAYKCRFCMTVLTPVVPQAEPEKAGIRGLFTRKAK